MQLYDTKFGTNSVKYDMVLDEVLLWQVEHKSECKLTINTPYPDLWDFEENWLHRNDPSLFFFKFC